MFTEHGIRAVGVDAIVAAADTAQDHALRPLRVEGRLVVAYLQRRAVQQRERLEQALATHRGSAAEQILHLYDLLAAELAEPGYRGSPFANACVELGGDHPAAAVAREHRQWLLATFTGLAAEATTGDPDALAAQLLLLYEGAATQVIGHAEAARTARTGAEGLLSAAQFPTAVRSVGTVAEHPTGPARSAFAVSPPYARAAASNRVGSQEAHRLVAFLNSAHLPDGDDQLADDRAGPWLTQWLPATQADRHRPGRTHQPSCLPCGRGYASSPGSTAAHRRIRRSSAQPRPCWSTACCSSSSRRQASRTSPRSTATTPPGSPSPWRWTPISRCRPAVNGSG